MNDLESARQLNAAMSVVDEALSRRCYQLSLLYLRSARVYGYVRQYYSNGCRVSTMFIVDMMRQQAIWIQQLLEAHFARLSDQHLREV